MIVLSEGIGYLILLGAGLIMALAVTSLVRAETKWLGTKKTFEWFSTAGRSVKTGLIASSVVSAWTWAATLLQSSTVAYQFGISGPFWYAAGASIQVILFAILAMELKRKAPSSHTFPEMIFARFGKNSHKVFLFFALMTNTIVTAMLVLGGAAVVNSLTGIDIYVAAFLIPVGVIIYTFFGGLKATFLAEYLNTVFLFTVVLVFVIAVYFVNPQIGGISGMFAKLTDVAIIEPVQGNVAGSYLTMASSGALIFGIINIVGNFGTVFVDQSYWQRAIAAGPRSAFKGFIIGGLAWFAIPFTLATTLGLSAVAIGAPLTPEQIGMGLVAPTAASQVLGEVGAILLLTMLFTAVTSAGSAELISVSSLITYDVYRTYVKPSATGRGLMRISRLAIVGFGMGMGLLALILLQVGASLQYIYLAMGVLIGSAVVPITLAIVWKRTNKVAATVGALAGLVCGVAVWLASSDALYGMVSVSTTSQNIPLLTGNFTSILVGAIVTWVGIAVTWAGMAATVIVLLPLIESRVGIVKVLQRIGQGSVEEVAEHNAYYYGDDSSIYQKRILVPVDGSQQSLRALNYAASIYATSHDRTMIYILNVIEWADGDEESMDEELAAAIEEQGRRMLRSIMIPKSAREYERMVKLGNPATKIVEMTEKLKVNMIVMGATGLSNSKDIGHVSREVLKLTSIPVMFMK